jgi:hypothetical protein
MKMIRKYFFIFFSVLITMTVSGCSVIGTGKTHDNNKGNTITPTPKNSQSLLFVAITSPVGLNNISVMVGDKTVGSILSTEAIAVHLKPGDYTIRSSYQACFPAEVTLRKGEILLVQAENTEKGIYFKPVPYSEVEKILDDRQIIELKY